MNKVDRVPLANDTLGVIEDFEITHAERLLRMPNNGGWHLPEDSEYKFSHDNGIIRERSKGKDTEGEKARNDKKSDSTSKSN